MYELLLNSAIRKIQPPPNTLVLRVSKSTSAASFSCYFRRIQGAVTYDVPGRQAVTAGDSYTLTTVNIPANAELMYFDLTVNPTGSAGPAFQTRTNSRIVEVMSWDTIPSGHLLSLTQNSQLVKVPDTSPPMTNWSALLAENTNFIQDLSVWDTSQVTNMYQLFQGCVAYNKSISQWNVSKVTNISQMFRDCTVFNQNLSNMTFPLVSVANRSGYDQSTPAWLTGNKPNFAIT